MPRRKTTRRRRRFDTKGAESLFISLFLFTFFSVKSAVCLQTSIFFTDDWVYTDRSNEEGITDILDLMGAQLEPPPLASTTFSTSTSMRSK